MEWIYSMDFMWNMFGPFTEYVELSHGMGIWIPHGFHVHSIGIPSGIQIEWRLNNIKERAKKMYSLILIQSILHTTYKGVRE